MLEDKPDAKDVNDNNEEEFAVEANKGDGEQVPKEAEEVGQEDSDVEMKDVNSIKGTQVVADTPDEDEEMKDDESEK